MEATGELTLRGVTKSVTVELEAKRQGGTLVVNGSAEIDFDDFEIPDASGGPATVGRTGSFELLLVFARVAPRGRLATSPHPTRAGGRTARDPGFCSRLRGGQTSLQSSWVRSSSAIDGTAMPKLRGQQRFEGAELVDAEAEDRWGGGQAAEVDDERLVGRAHRVDLRDREAAQAVLTGAR